MNQNKQQQQQQNPQTEHKVTIFIAFSEMENKTKHNLLYLSGSLTSFSCVIIPSTITSPSLAVLPSNASTVFS